jgi:hypothetical protein
MSNLIPAGYYRAVAAPVLIDGADFWAQFGETSTGNPQVAVQFAILDGPQQGRRVTWFGFFTEKTIKRTIESLRLCGLKGDNLEALLTQKLNQEVSITVGHNTWDNKTTARVEWVNAPGGGGLKLEKPMNKDQLRMFSAKMKNHTRQVQEVAGQQVDAPAPAAGPPADAPDEPPQDWASNSPPPMDEPLPF